MQLGIGRERRKGGWKSSNTLSLERSKTRKVQLETKKKSAEELP